jgi:nicotinate-nucleotide adenylyltransferase
LGLDKLIVMPTYLSPHKENSPAPAQDRINMLKIAFSGVQKAEISDFEILKQGKSYTYQTVEHFSQDKDVKLYFIVGGDMLVNFKSWRYPERILKCCTLAVFSRENFFVDYEKEREYFHNTFNADFVRLNYVGQDYSSTKIRTYAKLGLSLSGLTPNGVEEYIREKGVYTPDKYEQFILKTLPEKRLKHTADVVVCALKKAKDLGLDEERVRIATLLHDSAKYIEVDKKDYEKYGIPSDCPSQVVHQYMGAYIAEKELGITDLDVLNAIRYHTSGRKNMSLLEKIIYTADIIEPSRKFNGVEELRIAVENNFESGFITCVKEILEFLQKSGEEIYPLSVEACEFYQKEN